MQTTNNQQSLKEMLHLLLEDISNLEEDTTKNIFVYQEAKIVLQDLIDLLSAHANTTAIVTINTLKPFCEWLSDYWFRIKKNKNLSYLGPSESIAIRANILLANYLAKHLHMSVWMLLMPTVSTLKYFETVANEENFNRHEFILGYNDVPINVRECLERAADNKTLKLMHTANPGLPLNDGDAMQVINYTPEAAALYATIEAYKSEKDDANLKLARERFVTSIKTNQQVVTDTPNDNANIAKYILSRLRNFQKLADMLITIKKMQWIDFLNAVSNEDLVTIVLNKQTLEKCITKGYTGDVLHDQAVLFCLAEVYWRNRDDMDKYTSRFGWLSEYTFKMVGGFSKDEKEAAVILLQVFLLSHYQLNGLEKFLENLDQKKVEEFLKLKLEINDLRLENDANKSFTAIMQLIRTDKQIVIKALYAGTLGMFPKQLKELCAKEEEVENQRVRGLGKVV